MRTTRVATALMLMLGSAPACDHKPNAPLVATATSAVDAESFAATARAGLELHRRELALDAAVTHGLSRVGSTGDQVLMALSAVDANGKTASVSFFRWLPRDVPESGELSADRASRWLVIPVNLATSQVLEAEQFGDYLSPADDEYQFVACIIESGRIASEMAPGGRWSFHPAREIKRDGTPGTDRRTRVYALASDGKSPDLELVFGQAKKDTPPALLDKGVHHTASGLRSAKPTIEISAPSVMTVARVLGRNPSDLTQVKTPAGTFVVEPDTGAISQVGAASPAAPGSADGR